MKEHQTPRKDVSYRRPKDSPTPTPKSISDHIKKSTKVARKNLSSEFTAVAEDLLTESVTESVNFSPISGVLSVSHNGESIDSSEWLFPAENGLFPVIEEAHTPPDSIASSVITANYEESCVQSAKQLKIKGINCSIEAEVVADHLKQARDQVLSSNDINPGSKNLLDALLEVSLKELGYIPNEDDKIDVLLSNRSRLLVLYFAVWLIISLSMLFSSGGSSTQSSASFYPFYPSPT